MSPVALRCMLVIGVAYVLICIPGIFLSEGGWIPIHQSFFHASQFMACACTFVVAGFYVAGRRRASDGLEDDQKTKGTRAEPNWALPFAISTLVAIGVWFAFIVFVVIFFASTMSDFDD